MFVKINLQSGYHQLKIEECDVPKSAFQTRYGHYEFLVIPLMDLLNQVFKEYLDKFMILLIDDILMYSKSWDEHKEHFCIVLQTLKEHKLYEKIF